MYHKLFCLISMMFIACGVQAAEPQHYPNLPPPPVLFENEKVIVQGMPTVTTWTGLHTHEGNQLVVVLEPFTMEYMEDGETKQVSYASGEVFWIGSGEHDHRAVDVGRVAVITIK